MKTAKLGAIFMVSITALTVVGIGYSAWTDTIYIEGTVNTGSVDLKVVKLSGTWTYKLVETGEWFTWHGWADPVDGNPLDDIEAIINEECNYDGEIRLVAYGTAYLNGQDQSGDSVVVVWDNLFPLTDADWIVDIVFHYDGSIPVKINDINYDYTYDDDDWIAPLITNNNIWAHAYRTEDPSTYDYPLEMPDLGTVYEGTQLHKCDYVKLDVHFNLPQDDTYMGRSASGTAQIQVVQWNEYPYQYQPQNGKE
ncbi:MAG: hypothetical protein ACQXXD_06465 [Thermoplasmatota archaeon]|jgi:hypothetical protein